MQPTTKIINTKFPNGQAIRSTIEGVLYLPKLQNTARQAHICPNINHSLVSIGSICGVGCTVKFNIKYVTAACKNYLIPRGWRHHHIKLWYFLLAVNNEDEKVGDNKNNLSNNVYEKKPKYS